jgi:hypothetical protein
LALLAHAPSARAGNVGRADVVEADVIAENARKARRLQVTSPIIAEDLLKTGAGTRLQATLLNGTRLALSKNGALDVDEFVFDPAKRGGRLGIDITRGAFLFVGGKLEAKNGATVNIRTPVATLGVRGTTVWGGNVMGGYGVLVISGEVVVQTPRGSVTLKQGQGTVVTNGKPGAAGNWPTVQARAATAAEAIKAEEKVEKEAEKSKKSERKVQSAKRGRR